MTFLVGVRGTCRFHHQTSLVMGFILIQTITLFALHLIPVTLLALRTETRQTAVSVTMVLHQLAPPVFTVRAQRKFALTLTAMVGASTCPGQGSANVIQHSTTKHPPSSFLRVAVSGSLSVRRGVQQTSSPCLAQNCTRLRRKAG